MPACFNASAFALGSPPKPPRLPPVVAEFAAAVADEYQLDLLLETGRIVDIVRGDAAAAEEADVGELVEVLQGDLPGLHSAHGQAGHGAMGLIGERAEVGIDVGDQLVDENRLEWPDVETCEAADPDVVGHAVGHHDEEGLRLAFGDQVVHDQIGVALVAPGGFILAPAVLQVQHRIALGLVLVVVGRRVDKGTAGGVGALRGEENLLHSAVGNVLEGVEVLVVGGDFDAAFPASRTVEVQGAGIVECSPINREMVVVEAFIQRPLPWCQPRRRLRPLERRSLTSAQTHADALGLGRDDAKSSVALGVDLRDTAWPG